MPSEKNLEKYRELSEPFPDADAANDAVEKFYAAMSAARDEFKIPDVLCVISLSVQYESGEGEAITYFQAGDAARTQVMAAYVYGQEQQKQREELNRLLSGKPAKG